MEVTPMYKNILVPTDGTEFAEKAFSHAIDLAKKLGAKVTGVTVTAPFTVVAVEGVMISQTPDDYDAWAKQTAQKRLQPIRDAATKAGVTCEVVHVESFQAYEGIIDAANKKGCDLIVMASHGRRGVSALLLGSEAQKVLTHSSVPVLIYR
jgi:nucleotide-binding universal stress UspA family protein